ncbi:putative ribosomal protein S18 [Besnoitia besnoiti]|uniref:Putative ribosomal protein S18 n=1 Tax=Besnoitia besnoiti TaxID=94643 RepID=A0A2A9MIH7_BESBE|nr:putative ribosomal protein S18 [Besnoitia besnoiti]PFH35387.1 putative ribosomal protein S18 [Besnoitia besnoiti]
MACRRSSVLQELLCTMRMNTLARVPAGCIPACWSPPTHPCAEYSPRLLSGSQNLASSQNLRAVSSVGPQLAPVVLAPPQCPLVSAYQSFSACGGLRASSALGDARRHFYSRFKRPLPFAGKEASPATSSQHPSQPTGLHGSPRQPGDPQSRPSAGAADGSMRAQTQTHLRRGTSASTANTVATSRGQDSHTGKHIGPSFAQQFLNDKTLAQDMLQFTKVSEKGTADALFAECLDSIRHRRFELDPDVDNRSSEAVEKLTQEERAIATMIFQRVDPERKIAPRLETRGHYIDPLWDPFKRVEELQQQVAHDLTEFAKLVGAAEARRQRLLVRASLRRQYRMHDPLSEGHRRFFGAQRADPFPTPHRVHERFWDPSPEMRVALKNNNVPISWRDLHILHHFVGENGLILPRRTTHASRYQQRCIFKAICMARRMALFPYDWKPTQGELMPVMDPLQYLVDELTSRYKATGDLRADAMLCVMLAKYPKLNYFRYLQYKARSQKAEQEASQQQEEEDRGDFSRLLRKYKRAGTPQDSRYRLAPAS